MTPFGVRSLSRPAVTAESHTRVATLGRVFHQVGPFEFLDTTGFTRHSSSEAGVASRRQRGIHCRLLTRLVTLSAAIVGRLSPRFRLNAILWTRVCITCKEEQRATHRSASTTARNPNPVR